MTNSDSEDADFESADEDFMDDKVISHKNDSKPSSAEVIKTTNDNSIESKDLHDSENSEKDSASLYFDNSEGSVQYESSLDNTNNAEETTKTVKINETTAAASDSAAKNKPTDASLLQSANQSSYWSSSGWGSWGQSLISNSWSNSISTFATQLGEGLNTVVETVEQTLEVSSPEIMAKESLKEKSESADQKNIDNGDSITNQEPLPSNSHTTNSSSNYSDWFSGWGVSGFTTGLSSTVQKTGTSLMYGGIDVLETIGKKTMDVLHETDPGLTRTKALLRPGSNKPNLSQILKEAQCQEMNHAAELSASGEATANRDCHFGALLESEQALVHLEALEMLSKSCEMRLQSRLDGMPTSVISQLKPKLANLQMILESILIDETMDEGTPPIPVLSDEEMNQKIEEYWKLTKLGVHQRIGQNRLKYRQVSNEVKESSSAMDIHRQCMENLAYLTARLIESFHKAGEIITAKPQNIEDWQVLCTNLIEVVRYSCSDNEIMCSEYIALIKMLLNNDNRQEINKFITNIYLELSNSKSYIEDSFQILIPIIKFARIES